MVRVCDNIRSLNEAIDTFVERGKVSNPAPKKRKRPRNSNRYHKQNW